MVINLVNKEEELPVNLYSSFYAAFMEDEVGAIIITTIVLLCFSLCFGFTICLIFAANRQVDMLRTVRSEKAAQLKTEEEAENNKIEGIF